jgi:hypothetical protein
VVHKDGNSEDKAKEGVPNLPSSPIPKVVVPVNMEMPINRDDLMELPKKVNQESTVSL